MAEDITKTITYIHLGEYWLFIWASLFSFLAGLIRQLQLKKNKAESFVGAMYACMFGLATTLMWYTYFPTQKYMLLGLVIIASLTGVTSVNQFIALLLKIRDAQDPNKPHDKSPEN